VQVPPRAACSKQRHLQLTGSHAGPSASQQMNSGHLAPHVHACPSNSMHAIADLWLGLDALQSIVHCRRRACMVTSRKCKDQPPTRAARGAEAPEALDGVRSALLARHLQQPRTQEAQVPVPRSSTARSGTSITCLVRQPNLSALHPSEHCHMVDHSGLPQQIQPCRK
jgi:hypothetical protein